MSAQQAKEIGLVTRISATPESLIAEVQTLADRLAAKSPAATIYVKQAARAALELDLRRGLDRELDLFALLAPSDDVKEAALAFKEKRTPVFTGD